MEHLSDLKREVRQRAYRFTLHAGERMTARRRSVSELEEALLDDRAKVIENYPNDPRGPSCLVLGTTHKGRPLHVQCTYPPRVAIITAYEPDDAEWIDQTVRRET